MTDLRDEVVKLAEGMSEAMSIAKKMSESLVDQRSHVTALQLAFLAIAEQMVANGSLDAERAAARLHEMGKTVAPEWKAKVRPKINFLAAQLDALSGPITPRPPRGSKPRIVK